MNSDDLIEKIESMNALQGKFLSESLKGLTDDELFNLNNYIVCCLQDGIELQYLADSYLIIIRDTMKEQMFFHRHKRYRYSKFEDVASRVYFDSHYMKQYMVGLALTSFLWPNHVELFRFFYQTLPRNVQGSYLEIGPGHGLFFMTAMRNSSYTDFTGIDISPTSVELTKKILQSHVFGDFPGSHIIEQDFLDWIPETQFQAIVMGEVLEHVEEPEKFLKKIRAVAGQDAYIFITTCFNAPMIDHIYLYRNIDDLEQQLVESRLNMIDYRLVPYLGKTLETCWAENLPVNIAFIVKKTEATHLI